jgi:hypothetical protein
MHSFKGIMRLRLRSQPRSIKFQILVYFLSEFRERNLDGATKGLGAALVRADDKVKDFKTFMEGPSVLGK